MNWTMWTWLAVTILTFAAPQFLEAEDVPYDHDMEAVLDARVKASGGTEAIVVGIIDEHGARIINYGDANGQGHPANGDTVFEIGSITKVFTSLIFADMVNRGEVKLDDPISKYLPRGVHMKSPKGREITLLDLATHTSGLPRLPDNLAPRDPQNPYADYSVDNLYDFLRSYTPTNEPGAKFEYSNLGVGLLGHLLALRAKTNYEALVIERVCRPLGMTNTMITLTPEMRTRLAVGHDETGKAVENWDLPTLAGAGALRSTVNDMLKLVAASLGKEKTSLRLAMELTEQTRHEADSPTIKIGLGWMKLTMRGNEVVWHNGGTGGYRSFMGYNKHEQRAVVILANSANDVDNPGWKFLGAASPEVQAREATPHVEIKLAPKVLAGLAGRYQFSPEIFFDVRRAGDRLEGKMTGQSYLPLFASSEVEFFNDSVKATITFNRDANNRVTSLVLHQGGLDQTANKISNKTSEEKTHTAIPMETKVFDGYVGEYSFGPGVSLTVKREGEKFYVMLTGQSFLEVFPESETDFFLKVVDAQLTFVKDEKAKVVAVILHQGGRDQRAARVR